MHRSRTLKTAFVCAAFAAALPVAADAQQRTVSRVVVVAKPSAYTGHCPAHLRFVGTIFVTRHPVWVEYEWERSDGGRGPRQRIEIRSAGQGVTDTWELGAGHERMRVWEKLHVLAPTGISSPAASVAVNCR